MADVAAHYAFPHTRADERRRLELFEERLDPVTIRRIKLRGLGLENIGADAELDIVQPGTALSEFYRLSITANSPRLISAGVVTAAEAAMLTARLDEPDFMACGFAFIGAWGRRNAGPRA